MVAHHYSFPTNDPQELDPVDEKKYDASKAAFIRKASHDIQGTFFGVSSLVALLKYAHENKEDMGQLVDHLVEACHSYKIKLSNFVEYARFDAGMVNTISESLDIRHLISRNVREHQFVATEKKIHIALSIPEDMPEKLTGDEFRIAQICTNLLSNALQFSPAGTTISIRIGMLGKDQWSMVIEDQGLGMSPEELDCVFKFQAEDRKPLKNAGGLGLLVTRYLVEDVLKGKITLSSQLTVGTTCTVVLPAKML